MPKRNLLPVIESEIEADLEVDWQLAQLCNYYQEYEKSREALRKHLIDKPDELSVHRLLAKHPLPLLNAIIGGFFPVDVNRAAMFSRMKLGAEFETDFAFVHSDSGGSWWVFVELERPDARLFNNKGDPTATLTHALRQITDWRCWLNDNRAYAREQLRKCGGTPNLHASRPFWRDPQFLIIIGRRSSLSAETNRRRVELCNMNPGLQILTYDRLVDPFGHHMRWGTNGNADEMQVLDELPRETCS